MFHWVCCVLAPGDASLVRCGAVSLCASVAEGVGLSLLPLLSRMCLFECHGGGIAMSPSGVSAMRGKGDASSRLQSTQRQKRRAIGGKLAGMMAGRMALEQSGTHVEWHPRRMTPTQPAKQDDFQADTQISPQRQTERAHQHQPPPTHPSCTLPVPFPALYYPPFCSPTHKFNRFDNIKNGSDD